jgi:hypothetical protein
METTTTHETIETTKRWEELEHREINAVIAVHAKGLRLHKNSTDKLRRIFDLTRPKIVLGYKDGILNYCRVASESVEVLKIAIRTYM